jgi:4-hydroxy-4-methyl-2-oxoglutarate aldolase
MSDRTLTTVELQQLRRLSSCAVANAIELLGVRLRNEGFTDGPLHLFTTQSEPAVGFAATIKIRSSSPPIDAPGYLERTQWWDYILSIPEPRFLVIEDVDPAPGTGALIGEVHAQILKALNCNAVATNGAVRDIPEVARIGFSMFAHSLSVSHAYSHIVEAGCPVEVSGLTVSPGDLLHGDCHGIVRIPEGRVSELLAISSRLQAHEAELLRLCRSPDFSVERLRHVIRMTRNAER